MGNGGCEGGRWVGNGGRWLKGKPVGNSSGGRVEGWRGGEPNGQGLAVGTPSCGSVNSGVRMSVFSSSFFSSSSSLSPKISSVAPSPPEPEPNIASTPDAISSSSSISTSES